MTFVELDDSTYLCPEVKMFIEHASYKTVKILLLARTTWLVSENYFDSFRQMDVSECHIIFSFDALFCFNIM